MGRTAARHGVPHALGAVPRSVACLAAVEAATVFVASRPLTPICKLRSRESLGAGHRESRGGGASVVTSCAHAQQRLRPRLRASTAPRTSRLGRGRGAPWYTARRGPTAARLPPGVRQHVNRMRLPVFLPPSLPTPPGRNDLGAFACATARFVPVAVLSAVVAALRHVKGLAGAAAGRHRGPHRVPRALHFELLALKFVAVQGALRLVGVALVEEAYKSVRALPGRSRAPGGVLPAESRGYGA